MTSGVEMEIRSSFEGIEEPFFLKSHVTASVP